MSLDGLIELMSVSNKAGKALNKSGSGDSSDKLNFFAAGSPFDSPRSLTSASDKSEHIQDNRDKNIQTTPTSSAINGENESQNPERENKPGALSLALEDATVIEVIPCKVSSTHTSETEQPEDYNDNMNSNNNIKKVSISKKHLREIISPQNELPQDERLGSSHESQGSRESHASRKNYHQAFPKEVFYAERHEPESDGRNISNNRVVSCEREDSASEGTSSVSDQPEIIDVYEQVIAVTSGLSQSPDAITMVGTLNKMEEVPKTEENQNGISEHNQTEKNMQNHGLRQGALNKGVVDPSKTSLFDDVYISQFGLTEKQRGLKEALAKRSQNNKPKKKLVQPQIIHNNKHGNIDTGPAQRDNLPDTVRAASSIDPAVTAAAAASAAVAAAQPFLKTQHELETRMQQLLAQLSELQQNSGVTGGKKNSTGSESRILDLERQVAELNERRFEHLENLQQQQMQMQAQLLFMSRSRSPNNHEPYAGRWVSSSKQFLDTQIPQAVSKQVSVSSQKTNIMPGNYFHQQNAPQAKLTLDPNRRGHAAYNHMAREQTKVRNNTQDHNSAITTKHHNYLNEVRELQGSHLNTPAPRNRVPKPTPYTLPQEPQKNLVFLENLLGHHDTSQDRETTFSVRGEHSSPTRHDDCNNSARGRRLAQSPVDKARQLVTSLSNLEKETADSIWGSKDGLNKPDLLHVDLGPAPLDHYLKYPKTESSPYPKLSHHSKEKRAMLHNLDNLLEAKNILRQLEQTHETLEKNIDQVVRSRRDIHVFSTLLGSGSDNSTEDQLKIEKMVAKKISALEEDVQREALRLLAETEAEKLAAKKELEQQQQQLTARYRADQARSGTSLRGQALNSARLAQSKLNTGAMKSITIKGKENKSSKVKPPPKPAAIRDEATRARTYGKPVYERGRTTIRDPYLHFKNTKKGVAAKSSVTNLNESARSRDGRSRSPASRSGQDHVVDPMPRQFYFSPTRGYIPLGATDTAAPVQGHLIPMAVPLGAPRLEPGLRRSAVTMTTKVSGPVSSTPVPVTAAARNAALVSFSVDNARLGDGDRFPEMTKQVLPPVDIDSISPSSSQRSGIHIISPQQDNANVTFLYSTRNGDEIDLDRTLTEESSDLEQDGEGIKLPGYQPKHAEYVGPAFPPRTAQPIAEWTAGGREPQPSCLVSDVMAEDLRRRDVLESNAVMWLEQELMARILSQVMPLPAPEKCDEVEAESEDGEIDESLLAAAMIGQSGMQLFIDAGQPVDNALVQQLIREVIQEKINSMLAARTLEAEGQPDRAKTRGETDEAVQARERSEISAGPPRVPTPKPTPRTSPVPSPRQMKQPQQHALPATPTPSPPPDGYRFKPVEPEPPVLPEPVRQPQARYEPPAVVDVESESETSVSINISEELRRVAGKPPDQDEQITVCNDVTTPAPSPPAVLQEKSPTFLSRPATPPPSPSMTRTSLKESTSLHRRMESVARTDVESDEGEEETVDEPQPIMISVAVGDERAMKTDSQTQHRSPPIKRPPSPDSLSETPPTLTETSTTETVNEFISEGQWLLSYSEGQVVGAVNYEAIRKEIVGRGYQHIIDVSTASTLKDMDDLDLDAEGTKSEGEFLYGAVPDPDKDPRLEVLAHMQKRHMLGANVRQIQSGPASREMMSNTGRSVGELSVGQVPPSSLASEQARGNRRHKQRGRVSPPAAMGGLEEIYMYNGEKQDRKRDQLSRTPSPQQKQRNTASPMHDLYSRTPSPQREHRSMGSFKQDRGNRTPSPVQQQRNWTPPPGDQRSISPQQQWQESKGTRPRGQMQYQPVLSEGRPTSSRGRTLPGQRHKGQNRSSESRMSHSSDPGMRQSGSIYNSESDRRSADAGPLRNSADGFLTSSLKSRQSGIKKSVEFDLSSTQKSNMRHSWNSSYEHKPGQDYADGLTYTEESLDESELRRIVVGTSSGSAPYKMSVTIPSAAEEEAEESELSEIDISNKNGM